jgi:uncharacterized membrane protein
MSRETRPAEARSEGRARGVERAVSYVLRAGVLASGAIICLGLLLLALKGKVGSLRLDEAIPYPRTLQALASGLASLDPASIIALGLLALVATPFARVAVSIAAFASERDWRYVAITAIVLAILVASVALGLGI